MSTSLRDDRVEILRRHFELRVAHRDSDMHDVFHVRHEVYCRDFGYFRCRDTEEETDEYDAQSIHYLLRFRSQQGRAIGCGRLVLTRPDRRDSLLPFEACCAGALDRSVIDPSRLPRDCIAEASRLAVMADFRVSETGRRGLNGCIPVILILSYFALSIDVGIEYLFVLSDLRMANYLARLGFDIRRIGAPVEHHGLRIPSLMRPRPIVASLRPKLRSLYEFVRESIPATPLSAASTAPRR